MIRSNFSWIKIAKTCTAMLHLLHCKYTEISLQSRCSVFDDEISPKTSTPDPYASAVLILQKAMLYSCA